MAVGEVMVEQNQGAWLVTLLGEHDISTKPSLRDALERVFDLGSKVVVDLSQVEFIDSGVLAALAYGHQRTAEHAEHLIAVVAPSGAFARHLLELTRMDRMIRVYESRSDAAAAI